MSKVPQPIVMAKAVAEDIQKLIPHDEVQETARLLPRLAMAFNQAGMDLTADTLRAHALRGVKHLRSALKEAAASRHNPPDYDQIVAGLKLPVIERVPDQHLSLAERYQKAVFQGNVPALAEVVVQGGIDFTDHQNIVFIGGCAAAQRNKPMLDYLIAETHRHCQRTEDDMSLHKAIYQCAAFWLAKVRDIESVEWLHAQGMDFHADNDFLFNMGFDYSCVPFMEHSRQRDPGVIRRNLFRLENKVTLLNALAVDYVLEHIETIGPERHEPMFRNLMKASVGGAFTRTICQKLPVSRTVLSEVMAELAGERPQAVIALHKQGGEFSFNDYESVRKAGKAGNEDLLLYMREQGIDLSHYLESEDLAAFEDMLERRKKWETLHGGLPYHELRGHNPERYHAQAYAFAKSCLEKEDRFDLYMAWNVSALFTTDKRIASYLQRWGVKDEHPLFSLAHDIRIPSEPFDIGAWGTAILKHGPEMARMVKWAHHLPQPPDSVLGTRLALAPFMYKRGGEFPPLAELCASFVVEEKHFDRALDLYLQQKSLGFPAKNIPDLNIDGSRFGMPGARFYRLPPEDSRGMFLGELVGCCQSVGSDGAACAENGFVSPESGFYVVEDGEKGIVGVIWAWRGAQDELVFDSLESKRGHMDKAQWMSLLNSVGEDLQSRAIEHDVTALMVGQGGGTPQGMEYLPVIPAQPLDHPVYEDSQKQYQIWLSDEYDRQLSWQRYSGFLNLNAIQPGI